MDEMSSRSLGARVVASLGYSQVTFDWSVTLVPFHVVRVTGRVSPSVASSHW